jgi:hypothetical protein
VGDDRSTSLRHPEVDGVIRRVDERHGTIDASRDYVMCQVINKGALDEFLQVTFITPLALFRSQIQNMVAAAIRPLREASIDVGLGGIFGPRSSVLRTSSPSLMAASITTCRAAYEDEGGLSVRVRSEMFQHVALPVDGAEGAFVASASSSEVVDVMPGMSVDPRNESVVITDVVALVLQIMPELQKLCRESSAVLLMEMVSLDALGVAMLPSPPPFETCESPVFVDIEGLLASDILIRLYLEKNSAT